MTVISLTTSVNTSNLEAAASLEGQVSHALVLGKPSAARAVGLEERTNVFDWALRDGRGSCRSSALAHPEMCRGGRLTDLASWARATRQRLPSRTLGIGSGPRRTGRERLEGVRYSPVESGACAVTDLSSDGERTSFSGRSESAEIAGSIPVSGTKGLRAARVPGDPPGCPETSPTGEERAQISVALAGRIREDAATSEGRIVAPKWSGERGVARQSLPAECDGGETPGLALLDQRSGNDGCNATQTARWAGASGSRDGGERPATNFGAALCGRSDWLAPPVSKNLERLDAGFGRIAASFEVPSPLERDVLGRSAVVPRRDSGQPPQSLGGSAGLYPALAGSTPDSGSHPKTVIAQATLPNGEPEGSGPAAPRARQRGTSSREAATTSGRRSGESRAALSGSNPATTATLEGALMSEPITIFTCGAKVPRCACGAKPIRTCDAELRGRRAGEHCPAVLCKRCAVPVGEKAFCGAHARQLGAKA